MPRVHLAFSENPIRIGESVMAYCGKAIPYAATAQLEGIPEENVNVCSKCFSKEALTHMAQSVTYIYLAAIIPGEESIYGHDH